MSTLKVNAIRGTGASSDAISVNSTDGTCTVNATNKSNRNLIINGAMKVAQRGTSSTDSGYGTVDRFQCLFSGTDEAQTNAQTTLTSSDTGPWEKGFRNAYKITNGNQSSGAGTDDYTRLDYRVEGRDIAQSGWNYTSSSSYITLSYWAKSSVAQTFYTRLKSQGGTAQGYATAMTFGSANTWTKFTHKIPGGSSVAFDNDNGEGFRVMFMLFRGTDKTDNSFTLDQWANYNGSIRTKDMTNTWYTTNDATFEITGVQLEVGDVATDFEHRSYGDELAKCQRYYWKWVSENAYGVLGVGWAAGTTRVDTVVPYPVTMRGAPSFTTGGNWSFSPGTGSGNTFTPTLERSTSSTAYLRSSNTSGLTAGVAGEYRTNNDTSAYIALSAEL